jgi:hypothetical protein
VNMTIGREHHSSILAARQGPHARHNLVLRCGCEALVEFGRYDVAVRAPSLSGRSLLNWHMTWAAVLAHRP